MAVRGLSETYLPNLTLARPEQFEDPLEPQYKTADFGFVFAGPASRQPFELRYDRSQRADRLSPADNEKNRRLDNSEVLGLALSFGALATTFFAPRLGTPLMIGAVLFQFFWPAQAEAQEMEQQWRPASCAQKDKKEEPYWIHIAVGSIVGGLVITSILSRFPALKGWGHIFFGKPFKPKPFKRGLSHTLMAPINRAFHYAGQVSLPVVIIEAALRWYNGYDHSLSPVGGIAGMFLWNRIGIQYWGLDRSGTSMLFILDRMHDALYQVQSGQDWGDINWYYLANRYGAISLFGGFRARLGRDFLARRLDQKLLSSVSLESGEAVSQTLVYKKTVSRASQWIHNTRRRHYLKELGRDVRHQRELMRKEMSGKRRCGDWLDEDQETVEKIGFAKWRIRASKARPILDNERGIVSKLLKASNKNNVVWLDETGRLCERDTGRLLGAALTEAEQATVARLLKGKGFQSLFQTGSEAAVVLLRESKFLQVKLSGDFHMPGYMLYWSLQEVVGSIAVMFPAWLLCGEDLGQNALFSIFKSPLTIPRLFMRYKLGVDTMSAMLADRLWKWSTETYVSKAIPLLAGQGFFRGHYDKAVCAETLDQFVEFHIGPYVWEGGLSRYNLNMFTLDNIPTTLAPLLKRADFAGESPFSPLGVSYRLLAKHYAGEEDEGYTGLGLEEVEAVSHHLDELIEEAERRIRKEVPQELLQYQDSTVIELARAISIAAYYANCQDHRRFERLIKEHRDWFRQFEEVGKDLDAIEGYVDRIQP